MWIAGADVGALRVRDVSKAEYCAQTAEEEDRGDKWANRHLYDAGPSNISAAKASSTQTRVAQVQHDRYRRRTKRREMRKPCAVQNGRIRGTLRQLGSPTVELESSVLTLLADLRAPL